jgi:hypothetical protein
VKADNTSHSIQIPAMNGTPRSSSEGGGSGVHGFTIRDRKGTKPRFPITIAAGRGLTKFVGYEREMEALNRAAEQPRRSAFPPLPPSSR